MSKKTSSIKLLRQQLKKSERERKFGWAQFFNLHNEVYKLQIQQRNKLNELKNNEDMPKHHIDFIEELLANTKEVIECPICLDDIVPNNLSITSCGHKFCKNCRSKIEICSICRKPIPQTK